MLRHVAAIGFATMVVAGCAEDPAGAGRLTEAPLADSGRVSLGDFEEWPFKPTSATLHCLQSGNDDGRLIVTVGFGDLIEYALNGQARSAGFVDLDTSVMPAWPDASSLGPIIARGLELCD